MSHRKIDNITVMHERVVIHAADDRKTLQTMPVSPLMGHEKDSLYDQFRIVGRELYRGAIQFPKRNESKAKKVYENCIQRFGTCRSRRVEPRSKEYKESRERFAREFARRMCA